MTERPIQIERHTWQMLSDFEDNLRRAIKSGVFPADFEPLMRGLLATTQVSIRGTVPADLEHVNGRFVTPTWNSPEGGDDNAA